MAAHSATARRLVHAAPVFAALGDETRLRLVSKLSADGPRSIAQLSDGEPVTRQAITKHLTALSDVGLVRSTREGRERIWEIKAGGLDDARLYLDQISQQWDAAIDRLRAFVETENPR
jgi:DNA-binding transcriptional ArsR family regulator